MVIDEKALWGIHWRQLLGIHLVAAYAHQSRIVVGQQALGYQRNESHAVAELLEQLDLSGRVVVGDA